MNKVTIRLPLFLATRLKMASAEMTGDVLEENLQALHFRGIPTLRKSDKCLRCGRNITDPEHQENGYGPECWDKIQPVEDKQYQGWLPRSKVEIIQADGTTTTPDTPKADPATAQRVAAERALEFTPRLYVKDERIHFKVPMSMNDAVRGADAPTPRFNSDERSWSYPATPDYAHKVMTAFHQYRPQMDRGFEELLIRQQRIEKAATFKNADDLPPIPSTKWEPWMHQLRAYHFGKDLEGYMEALDMGTGKSKVAVDIVMNRGHQSILIICPAKVVAVWPKEFAKHTDLPIDVIPLDNDNWTVERKVQEAEKAIALAKARGTPYAVVIGYESSWRAPFGPTYKKQGKRNVLVDIGWAKRHGFECVICDESHKIKEPTSKASEFAAFVSENSKQRLALTGTPMPNGPLDVFGQYRFLDRTIFGDNFTLFKRRYARTPPKGHPLHNKKIIGYQNEEELNEKFYSIAFRVESKDVLDLPPTKTVTIPVSLSKKAQKHYMEIEREMYTEIENGPKEEVPVFDSDGNQIGTETKPSAVSIKLAITKMLRLQQLTSGYLVDDNKNEVHIDTTKEDTLHELLEGLPSKEPVVVFCNFTHDIEAVKRVAEKLGRRYGELSGNQNDLVAACMPADKDILAVQIKSGGAGVDLTRAAYAVYFSTTVNLGDYLQSLKRLDRPGQTRPVTFYQLVAERTVDVKMYQALDRKQSVVDYVLGL